VPAVEQLTSIPQDLAEANRLPAHQRVDAGYVRARNLVSRTRST
jgi:hypothetical protein